MYIHTNTHTAWIHSIENTVLSPTALWNHLFYVVGSRYAIWNNLVSYYGLISGTVFQFWLYFSGSSCLFSVICTAIGTLSQAVLAFSLGSHQLYKLLYLWYLGLHSWLSTPPPPKPAIAEGRLLFPNPKEERPMFPHWWGHGWRVQTSGALGIFWQPHMILGHT